MNEPSRLSDREVTDMLRRRSARPAPDGLASAVLESLASERARHPVRTTGRSAKRPLVLLAAAALLLVGGALAAGSGVLWRPAVVRPVPAPAIGPVAIASQDAASPSPSESLSPSPTALSLDLTWTQVPLDEKSPLLAWIGDRFVLADADSGAVRTSTDGMSWQALQPSDAAPGYVDLLSGSVASWQDQVVGWLNPEDGADTPAKPPSNPRHIVTIVHPPAAPISTTPFKGAIESIGIGPRGIVAEVHSALDFEHWVTRKLGLRTNNDWTMHVKSMTFHNGVLEIKLKDRPGLKVVWADEGFEPGDLYDGGFGWYSPDGEHWTEMAPRDNSGSDFGSTLPTGGFGKVVGVSDGFIASGACTPDGCGGTGMWYSADGLTWRFLGNDPGAGDLRPWMGGALVTGSFDFWTSSGPSRLPIAADLLAQTDQAHNVKQPLGTGPLGLVNVSYFDRQALVSRNGIDFGLSPIPAQMADAFQGRLWGPHVPTVAVGDRTVLVLEWFDDGLHPATPSLWLGTFQP